MPSALLLGFSISVLIVMVSFGLGMIAERMAPAPPRAAVATTVPNFAYALIYTTIHALVVPGFSAVMLIVVAALGGGLIALPDDGLKLVGSAIIVLLSFDLAEYAFHRLQHSWSFLWVMHALHHSDQDMNVTTTSRHCWIELFIKAVFLYPLVGLVFRVGPNAMLIYFIASYYNAVPHINVKWSLGPFWMVLNAPQYHRIHHSLEPAHYNRNFAALFPLFDVLFGTFHRPGKDEYPRTGLAEVKAPPGVVEMLAWPFAARRGAGAWARRGGG
jgi:sterol desaturase/sphingolipid hydroxylase (fatty acid hydroxylase superfamily)